MRTHILCGSVSEPKWRPIFERNPYMGMLLSPAGWRTPWSRLYACDNDAFAYSTFGSRPDPEWWEGKGRERWLKMLLKIPADHPPLFVLLPDVPGNWRATVGRSAVYLDTVRNLGLRTAVALQDGCDYEEALNLGTDAVFVGGSKPWKRRYTASITKFFQSRGKWVHVGRVNPGMKSAPFLEYCMWLGVDSVDGTGYNRFSNSQLPVMERSVDFWKEELSLDICNR